MIIYTNSDKFRTLADPSVKLIIKKNGVPTNTIVSVGRCGGKFNQGKCGGKFNQDEEEDCPMQLSNISKN